MTRREAAHLAQVERENAQLRTALQRMVDWSDCRCEHDDENCCADSPDADYHCPGCVAAKALSSPPRADQRRKSHKRPA